MRLISVDLDVKPGPLDATATSTPARVEHANAHPEVRAQILGVSPARAAVGPSGRCGAQPGAGVRQDTALAAGFKRWVQGHPRVQACHMLSGPIDFMLEVVAADLEVFGQFLEGELLSLPAVKDASSFIVLNEVKRKRTALEP